MFEPSILTERECQDKIEYVVEHVQDELLFRWFVIYMATIAFCIVFSSLSSICRSEKRLDKVEERLRWMHVQSPAHVA